MQALHVFDGISGEEFQRMFVCFQAQMKEYTPDEVISLYDPGNRVGIILEGEADLIKYDQDGNRNIIEHLNEQDIFGRVFFAPYDENEVDVIACSKCRIVFFDYQHLIKRCENACMHHSILVSNVLQIFSNKTRQLHARIETLSQRSIRNKLLNYFYQLAFQNHSDSFEIPFSLNAMADYLFVDRSAMLREMKKMREDRIIESKGRQVKLLY
jgi:CRP-like cAMP-binding protein